MRADFSQWKGPALIAAICSSTVWLAATNQLELYVAPQYSGFATVMSVIGLVATAASVIRSHSHDTVRPSRLAAGASATATAGALLVAVSMIALPPATLTSSLASQREINSTGLGDPSAIADIAVTDETVDDQAFTNLSVQDWASILRQTNDASFYAGKTADAVGFIVADPEDPENMFYISRFLITHCAIDAQVFGVPVHMENWADTFTADEWVDATGEFGTNPSPTSTQAIVLTPNTIDTIDEPRDPYLY